MLVNTSFMLILNLHMRKLGHDDVVIGDFTSFRYLGVLSLAFPLGLWIKGKRLKPYFLFASIMLPVASFFVLETVAMEDLLWARLCFLWWGTCLAITQVCVIPFIMRHASDDSTSESISLSYSTFAMGTIIAGGLIAGLSFLGEIEISGSIIPFDEYHLLQIIIFVSCLSPILVLRVKEAAPPPAVNSPFKALTRDYDWFKIIKAVVPTSIIAVGAGLTIPFVNLFFNSVFDIDFDEFSLIGVGVAVLVLIAALAVPMVRRRWGYKVAITVSQTIALTFLVGLALTEVFADVPGMLAIAVICYTLRTPFMNMAGPMTTELVMKYVGTRNQEITTAIVSSIWSGSWFVSAKFFEWFRAADIPYYQIFLMTAAFYAVGITLYYLLIVEYQKRSRELI